MDRPGFRLALQLPRKYRCMDGCLACCIWVHLGVDAGIFTKGESHLSTGVKTPKKKWRRQRCQNLNLFFVNVVFLLHFISVIVISCVPLLNSGGKGMHFPLSLFPSFPLSLLSNPERRSSSFTAFDSYNSIN